MLGGYRPALIWTPTTGEILDVQREPENERDHRAVCLLKSSTIVGQTEVAVSITEIFRRTGGDRFSVQRTTTYSLTLHIKHMSLTDKTVRMCALMKKCALIRKVHLTTRVYGICKALWHLKSSS